MLSEIPGVFDHYPALWYTFGTMGNLLDSIATWPQPMHGQLEAVNDFFHNPSWLPVEIDFEPFPIVALRI